MAMSPDHQDSRPVPDPTLLTTEQLRRELGMLRELISARLDGMDKLFAERLVGVEKQFDATKEAQAALSTASATAVAAALQAQKEASFATQQSNSEAIRKSETGFNNEINSLKALIESTKETLVSSVGDLRSRLDRGEGTDRGVRESKTDTHQATGTIIGVIGGVVGIVSLVAMIMFGIQARQQPSATVVSPTALSPAK